MSDRKTTKRRAAHKSKSRSGGSLDVHFGEKLRARSQMLVPKLSQDVLGKALGVLYQQVSKYEKDINRMSTALMMKIAAFAKGRRPVFFRRSSGRPKEPQGDQDARPRRDVSGNAWPSPHRSVP
jgi:transcriptional regulator with XRE-family HTH domain